MNEPKPLFLYLKIWNVPASELTKIRKAGYCPVGVDSFEQVKVMQPLMIHTENLIAKAAFEAIFNSAYSQPKIDFAKRVARSLAGKYTL